VVTTPPPNADALDVVVTNNKSALRYEAHIDGELAGLTTYLLHANRVVFTHAEVYPQWEGKGVASALARGALDDVIAQGKLITPLCPFIVHYVRDHQSYLEYVDPDHRESLRVTAGESS
jgi:predicted GNAT family acetyltransferase